MVPLYDLGVSEDIFFGRGPAEVVLSVLPGLLESHGLKATNTYVSTVTWGILHQSSSLGLG